MSTPLAPSSCQRSGYIPLSLTCCTPLHLAPPAQVELLLGDLCERRTGHRNVAPQVVAEALRHMDCEDTGGVSRGAFLAYIAGEKRASLKALSFTDTNQDTVVTGFGADGMRDEGSDLHRSRQNRVSRAAAPPE